MHRLPVILLGLALATSSGRAPALHVHLYADHDHPEHRHGPSAHGHHHPESSRDDDRPHLESCEPGQHAVSIVLWCAAVPHQHVAATDDVQRTLTSPPAPRHAAIEPMDCRVHGPPPATEAPPRAPPSVFLT